MTKKPRAWGPPVSPYLPAGEDACHEEIIRLHRALEAVRWAVAVAENDISHDARWGVDALTYSARSLLADVSVGEIWEQESKWKGDSEAGRLMRHPRDRF